MRRLAPIVLVLLIPILGTGCATGSSPAQKASGANVQTALATGYSAVDNQYRRMQIGLTLPKGVTFPGHLPNTSDHYPLDAGTVMAQNYWLCAWLQAYLTSTPGTKNQPGQALQQLVKYVRMDTYTGALDAHGRSAVDTLIRDARKGAKKNVAVFTNASCGGPFYGLAH